MFSIFIFKGFRDIVNLLVEEYKYKIKITKRGCYKCSREYKGTKEKRSSV